jgi:hypothetical protein
MGRKKTDGGTNKRERKRVPRHPVTGAFIKLSTYHTLLTNVRYIFDDYDNGYGYYYAFLPRHQQQQRRGHAREQQQNCSDIMLNTKHQQESQVLKRAPF